MNSRWRVLGHLTVLLLVVFFYKKQSDHIELVKDSAQVKDASPGSINEKSSEVKDDELVTIVTAYWNIGSLKRAMMPTLSLPSFTTITRTLTDSC